MPLSVYVPRGKKEQRDRDVQQITPLATEIQRLKNELYNLQMEFIDIRNVQNETNKQPRNTQTRNKINVAERAAAAVAEMTKLQQELTDCTEKDEELSADITKDLAYYTGLLPKSPLKVSADAKRDKIQKKYSKYPPKLTPAAHLCTMRQMLERHG